MRQRLGARGRVAGAVLLAGALVPGALEAARQAVHLAPRCAFREAFAYVRAHWSPGDVLWVSHRVVYETYFGRPGAEVLPQGAAPAEVAAAGRAGRVWIVTTRSPFARPDQPPDSFAAALAAAGCAECERRNISGMEVRRYAQGIESPRSAVRGPGEPTRALRP